MGSKYSSELKQNQNNSHCSPSTSYARNGNESGVDALNVFHFLSCWRCLCFRPRQFKQTRNRTSDDCTTNNNNTNNNNKNEQLSREAFDKVGSENHAMRALPDATISPRDVNHLDGPSEGWAEAHHKSERSLSARQFVSSERNCLLVQPRRDEAPFAVVDRKKSTSLKSCRIGDEGATADSRRSLLSKLASLSTEGKQRLGYVRQRDSSDNVNEDEEEEEEENEENERDELLDHGCHSYDGRPEDFLSPVDSMEYFDDTPSTPDDGLADYCFRFRRRGEEASAAKNRSTDLYEESCLENLESFCDGSVLLASMDTVDLGSSVESLVSSEGRQDFGRSTGGEAAEGYVVMDAATYKSILDDLEACREMLGRLESILSDL